MTLLVVASLTAGAVFVIGRNHQEEDDSHSASYSASSSLQSWESWRRKGEHVITTEKESAALARAIDEHDRSVATDFRLSSGHPVKGLHQAHRSKHARRRERKKEKRERKKKEKKSGGGLVQPKQEIARGVRGRVEEEEEAAKRERLSVVSSDRVAQQ